MAVRTFEFLDLLAPAYYSLHAEILKINLLSLLQAHSLCGDCILHLSHIVFASRGFAVIIGVIKGLTI